MQKTDLNIASQILFEDNHLLVINKKVGQLVQGDKTGDESLLDSIKNFIKVRDNKPGNVFLGLVHRIDRPTSGLVIYAKTSKALSRLTQMVKNREIKKTYWAVVAKEMIPQSQRLVHYLKKKKKTRKIIKLSFLQNQLKVQKKQFLLIISSNL